MDNYFEGNKKNVNFDGISFQDIFYILKETIDLMVQVQDVVKNVNDILNYLDNLVIY